MPIGIIVNALAVAAGGDLFCCDWKRDRSGSGNRSPGE